MVLSPADCDREFAKFREAPSGGTCVSVCNDDGTAISGGGAASGATTSTIYNLSAPTANTEVSQALSATTKQLLIRVRGGTAKAQFSFVSTESATKFITIEKRAVYSTDGLSLTSAILYIQTDKAAQTIEILEWS